MFNWITETLQRHNNFIAKVSTNIFFWSVLILLIATFYQYTNRNEHQLIELPIPNTYALVRYDNPLPESNYDVVRFMNTTEQHIYVRINNMPTKKPHLTLFIRQGQAIRLHLPFGRYEILIAKGDHWYGEWDEALFGKDTKHFELSYPLVLSPTRREENIKELDIDALIKNRELKSISGF